MFIVKPDPFGYRALNIGNGVTSFDAVPGIECTDMSMVAAHPHYFEEVHSLEAGDIKVETKEVETKEVETKEVETKEVETKEVETKEVETKKAKKSLLQKAKSLMTEEVPAPEGEVLEDDSSDVKIEITEK
jgi:hypothetical protein